MNLKIVSPSEQFPPYTERIIQESVRRSGGPYGEESSNCKGSIITPLAPPELEGGDQGGFIPEVPGVNPVVEPNVIIPPQETFEAPPTTLANTTTITTTTTNTEHNVLASNDEAGDLAMTGGEEDATEMPEPDGSNGIDHHAPSSIQVLGGTVTGEPPVPSGLIGEQADLTRKYTDDTGDDDDDFKGINSQPDQTETGLTRSIFRAWGIFQGLAYDTVEAWRSLE
ncbi:hypothetical protein TREMEDRAFT_65453 [Tremella mesenterica DSM 1558]|uniref:uncharacterized protein n=1 Tax=Tremella mesenterica (strain ATCC 24925 / CBS 8224 / DSM 1558 / NBRC 9311 / NRRL Y-6157 / RJB 2259-6 / UBC 559-6) TaxID=578456 RepID=UPI00032D1BD8|nr:uncharacterized protein TREMEDRAFT_65453 [Tremella mesenterica DSM 1558]EIW66586.1 hypothetical protein TREMEDRAFT_65453 [Tremella mesenterica DSM 1558]